MDEERPVFNDSSVDVITEETGIIDDRPVLSLDTDDRILAANFKRWISDSQSYWNKRDGYNLDSVRNKNERYYLGKQIDKSRLYDYQVPYQDNQIYVGTQSIMSYVSGNIPSMESVPEDDEIQSRVMAEDLETAVNIHSERFELDQKIKSATKNMYIKRLGVIKLRFDPDVNDIVPTSVDPNKLILDKDCLQGEEPRFIAEICTDSVATLLRKFPDKESEIMKALGYKRKSQKLLGTIVAYNEVWFTDETAEKDEDRECVAWYFNGQILDKIRNPNFLYDSEGLSIKNFIDRPTKPYIFFNYINDGSKLIDQTTPIEQAIPLQDVLNKRGRQIVENGDAANSILVLRSGAMSKDQAANITRDPNQTLMLDVQGDMPIQQAFGEIPPHMLPAYVMNDKEDAKNAIHNILGTPSQFRGDDSKREVGTLGEARMMQSQSSGRQDEVVRSVESSMNRYFRLLVQMMKVYYTEKRPFAARDNDGKFMYVQLSRESMPDIASVSISKGSVGRPDKERKENIAMNMAQLGLIDPYNLFKDVGLKDADKRYESLVKFRVDPNLLVDDITNEVGDRDAYIDFSIIMNGQEADPRTDIQPAHIEAHRKQLLTDRFLYAKPELQQKVIEHIQSEVMMLSQRAQIEEASDQGLLVDPNTPVTPEPPQLPPPPMPGEMPPGAMPPGMPPMDMPPEMMAAGGAPMPGVPDAGGAPPMPQGPVDAGVLSGLIPGM